MNIFVGLGNPEEKYDRTRHNIGFEVLDKINKDMNLSDFKEAKKFNALVSKKTDFILAKPLTYMNKSGEAVSRLVNFHKIGLNELVIIHDDVDLPLGKIKIGFSEGTAGHNGVASITNLLGSKNFWRVRIGVSGRHKEKTETDKYVLSKFSKEEQETVDKIIDKVAEEISNILKYKDIKQKGVIIE